MTLRVLRITATLLALAAALVSVTMLAPTMALDRHMLGHVLVGDVAAAFAVLALPTSVRSTLVAWIDRRAARPDLSSALVNALRSPVALLIAWTVTVSVLMLPVGHRWAGTDAGRVLEPVLLFGVGFCLWRATFDGHSPRPFLAALTRGGLQWWGRHVFAMVGRLAILPAIMFLWFAPPGRYAGAGADMQELAAGVVLGAEMSIFGAAFVLFFVLFLRDESTPTDAGLRASQRGLADGV